jgi:hypothetical protein
MRLNADSNESIAEATAACRIARRQRRSKLNCLASQMRNAQVMQ